MGKSILKKCHGLSAKRGGGRDCPAFPTDTPTKPHQNYSIIKQYVKAVEDKKLKFRYTAPKSQAIITQIGRIFGM